MFKRSLHFFYSPDCTRILYAMLQMQMKNLNQRTTGSGSFNNSQNTKKNQTNVAVHNLLERSTKHRKLTFNEQ